MTLFHILPVLLQIQKNLMLNRKAGPISHNLTKLIIPEIQEYEWANGTKVCEINLGSQDITKIEIVHKAGRSVEDHHLASRATSSLMKDGCGNKTSAQFAEEIDFLGASVKTASNMDFSYTTLHTLTRHADNLVPLLHEMYERPVFAEDEIEKFKKLNIQKLKEELTKNEVITYRLITEEIFGKSHAYGYNSTESDYNAINQSIIKEHFENYYGSDNRFVFISGKITDTMLKQLEAYFGSETKPSKTHDYVPAKDYFKGKSIQIGSQNEHQSAIKTGMKLFNKNHPDNDTFFVLNTIFGGYFGSRLMSKIREDLGYTYDIFSSVDQMLFDGCFYVSTEAADKYVPLLLTEIYQQMDILKQELVQSDELNMVKNYLMGSFMNMLDGPMNVSSFAKSMILSGKRPSDFNATVSNILETKPSDICGMAQKYFNRENMTEIVVYPV